jgi:hypothetical protein
MPEGGITAETKIIFTIKSFFGLMSSIIGLFFGFYMLVVDPKIKDHDAKYDKINEQLIQINNGIGTLSGTVDGMNERFNDLRNQRGENEGSVGGSLGN